MPESESTTPAAADEKEIWSGHTSQWVHFWYYFICLILAAAACVGIPFTHGLSAIGLVVPLIMALVRWWLTRSTLYVLTTQRLRIHSGVLNRRLEEVELYRVKDYVMEQPLFLRMLGRGHLTVVSSDASTRQIVLRAIADVAAVREQMRGAVQAERDRKRVRQLDVDDLPPGS